ncbi:hypothetical protein [Rhodococcus sp. UNC363MFTsu5.1]|uniref:hypothetical protein n=1 Tax=Rhodococcus sp. UNC363MFTsu5.1 TaxID=1449069 RepID=UPI000B0D7606|nr:hypothetical protein [Rhodococcus sp. UNC363MFTsu5.1]
MCYAVACSTCKKTTWGGCGAHVGDVMKAVPASERCVCEEKPAPAAKSGFFGRLFG